MKICFFRLSAIGDCVLATPALNAITKHFPDAEITWVTTEAIATLLSGMPNTKFMAIKKPTSFRDYFRLKKLFEDKQFDILLAAQASFRANLVYPFIKAERKIGFDAIRSKDFHSWFINESISYDNEHLAEGFMKFATHIGVNDKKFRWFIGKLKSKSTPSEGNPQRTIVLNVAASKKERSWAAVNYAKLVNKIEQFYDGRILLVGGNTDFDREQERTIKSLVNQSNCQSLVGKTSLLELVDILKNCDALISPDSGPVHIATALDIPVVGLYAVARPELSGPFASLQYTVNKYPEAVRLFLGKNVKEAKWHERVHDPRAMDLISVEEVAQATLRALKIQQQ
jgi:heptosyltransferase I|tara:strand:- start:3518 stop:4540 length:1023 start_codon:yes stop_codon:yes gene_type:complete